MPRSPSSPSPAMDARDGLVAGLLAAGLTAWLLPAVDYGVDPHHDGIMVKPALDVLAGQAMFRDTFTQYGALTTYLQAMALWFQPTLLAVRVLTLAAHVVTLFFLFAAWRTVLPRSLAAVSTGMFILFIPAYEKDWLGDYWMLMPWSSAYALMFQAVGLYALLRMIRGESPARWAGLLGAATACVFWCRTPVGLAMTACVALIWLVLGWTGWTPAGASRGRVLGGLLGGFVVVHVLMFIDVLVAGAAPEWWYQNFVWPRKWVNKDVVLSWHQFFTVFVHPGAMLWLLALPLAVLGLRQAKSKQPAFPRWVAPAVYAGVAAVMLWQHDRVWTALDLRAGGWTLLVPVLVLVQATASLTRVIASRDRPQPVDFHLVGAWTVLSLGALLQYYPLPDPWHILWAAAPAFGLLPLLLWRWLAWSPPAVAAAIAGAFLPAAYAKAVSFAEASRQPWVTLEAPALLSGMKVLPKSAPLYAQVAETLAPVLRQRPDLPAVLIGNDALYLCFVTNRTNPLPYFVNWPNLADAAHQEQRWRYIHEKRPLLFFQSAQWTAVGEFYQRERYVPLRYFPAVALEIAVPQEIADALGVATYGQPRAATDSLPPPQ